MVIYVPNAKLDIIVPGITAAVHVLDVLNSRVRGPVLAQPSAVVIIQPAVIPVVMYAQDKQSARQVITVRGV